MGAGSRLEWHDHRIHWMLQGIPPQVKDRSKRTKVFDWTVPIRVGAQPAAIHGELVWVPEEDWLPLVILAVFAASAVVVALALIIRRRRSPPARGPGPGGTVAPSPDEPW